MRQLPIYKVQVKDSKQLQGGRVMTMNIYPVGMRTATKGQMLTLHELRKRR